MPSESDQTTSLKHSRSEESPFDVAKTVWLARLPILILAALQFVAWYVDTLSHPLLYIGVPDEAEVALAAKSLAAGHGPLITSVGFLHGDAKTSLPHLHRYWSMYLSAWVAPFFWFFGPTRFAALLSASVLKSLLSFTVYLQIRSLSPHKWLPLAGGCIVLFDRTWSDRVNLYSDLFFATLAMFLSFACARLVVKTSPRSAFLAGIIAGLCVGAKPTGVLLLFVPVAVFLYCRNCRQPTRILSIYFLGCALGVAPLTINNIIEAGTTGWPDTRMLRSAGHLYFASGVDYMDAFYNPDRPMDLSRPPPTAIASNGKRIMACDLPK